MSARRPNFVRISRGAATLSAIAVLMTAGFAAPANAADGVPFQPTVSVGVQPASQTGTDIPLNLTLGAAAGQQWMTIAGANVPLTVTVDVYGAYATGTVPAGPGVPAGTTPAASGTFVATNGPGTYVLNSSNFSLGNFQYNPGDYTFVATVAKAGANDAAVTGDAVSPFGDPSATTSVSSAVAAPPVPTAPPIIVAPPTSRPVPVGGQFGRTTAPVATPTASASPVATGAPTASASTTANAGAAAQFATCADAAAAGKVNIPSTDPAYSIALDSNKDGVACSDNGSDSAVTINGGFARATDSDSTPLIAIGVLMILVALGAGASVLVRKRKRCQVAPQKQSNGLARIDL